MPKTRIVPVPGRVCIDEHDRRIPAGGITVEYTPYYHRMVTSGDATCPDDDVADRPVKSSEKGKAVASISDEPAKSDEKPPAQHATADRIRLDVGTRKASK